MTAESRRPVCPDAEQLAAFADSGLSAGERELIETHLSECDDCYEALVEIAAITAQIAAPRTAAISRISTRLRSRRSLWWIGGALAAAASVIFLINVNTSLSSPAPMESAGLAARAPDALQQAITALTEASRETRLSVGRLSVDQTWAEARRILRSGDAGADTIDAFNVRSSAQALKVVAAQDQSSRGLHAYGLALVASREYDAAIDVFDQALRQSGSDDAVIHSDLSAALLERYRLSGREADAERALGEADRALLTAPKYLNATFNRAWAFDVLGRPEARRAWQAYIELDRDAASKWRAEATRRLDIQR